MGKKKQSKKKKIAPPSAEEPVEQVQAPHSFVIHRGLPCPNINDLTLDFRRVMEPNTAIQLKETKNNKIKDFVSISSYFHVSYMCIFNKATTQLSFKIGRLPRGPTLTFKVHQFTLARDVISATKKQFVDDDIFKSSPLVIMNNFSGEGKHLKLMAHTFQSMFPAINIATVNLSTIKRCVLFTYDPIAKIIQFRHYSIVVVPVGLSRGVKKVVLRKIPNLSKCEDISDYFNGGNASESEFEDDEENHVVLPQTLKTKGNLENTKSAIRLYEIGPRITFELMKIEEGMLNGEVLYHSTIIKSEEEIEAIRKMREKKKKLKEQRKKQQEMNVEKKKEEKEIRKKKCIPGEKPKQEIPVEQVESDDDAEYYRQEVGEEPDEEIFKKVPSNMKRTKAPKTFHQRKKMKLDDKDKGDEQKKGFENGGKPGKFNKANKFNKSDRDSGKFNNNANKFNKSDRNSGKFNNKGNKFNKNKSDRDNSKSDKYKKGGKFNKNNTSSKGGKLGKPIYNKNKSNGKFKSHGKKKSRK